MPTVDEEIKDELNLAADETNKVRLWPSIAQRITQSTQRITPHAIHLLYHAASDHS